jgi:hypothetical protein
LAVIALLLWCASGMLGWMAGSHMYAAAAAAVDMLGLLLLLLPLLL